MANPNDIDLKITTLVDNAAAAKSLKDIKQSLRELQSAALEYSDSNQEAFETVTRAAGQLRDRLNDTRGSINSLSGAPIENLSTSLNLTNGALRQLDFGQAAAGLNNFGASIRGIDFGDVKNGLVGIADGFAAIGKALLANPIFLVAAIIAAVGAAFYELKDNGGAVAKVFGVIADATKAIIDTFKALSDAIGLTDFAGKKRNENELKRLEVEKSAIQERYELEASLAEATGKSINAASANKLKDAQKNSADLIQVTKDRIALTGRNEQTYTDEEKKEIAERVAAYKQATNELNIFYINLQKQARDNSIQLNKDIAQNQVDLATNSIDRAKKSAKAAADETTRINKEQNEKEFSDLLIQQRRINQAVITASTNLRLIKNATDDKSIIDTKQKEYEDAVKVSNDFQTTNQKYLKDFAQKNANELAIIEKNKGITIITAQDSSLAIQRDNNKRALDLILNDYKKSDSDKLVANIEYLQQEAKDIAKGYDYKISLAAKQDSENVGKLKKQKALELAANKEAQDILFKNDREAREKYNNDVLNNQLDFNTKQIATNKDYHLALSAQLRDDLSLIAANRDRELEVRRQGYEQQKKDAVGNADRLKQIESDYQRDVAFIKETADKADVKRQKDFDLARMISIRQNDLEATQLQLEHEQKTSTFAIKAQLDLIQKQSEINQANIETNRGIELQAAGDDAALRQSINDNFNAQIQANNDATRKANIDAKAAEFQQGLQIAQSYASALSGINDIINQGENDKLKHLKKGSAEAETIRKKQFERQKVFSIANTIINTASSVASALAVQPFPVGLALSIGAGVMGAAQIAKIASTKFDSQSADSSSKSAPSISAPSMATGPSSLGGAASPFMSSSLGANRLNSLGNPSNGGGGSTQALKVYVVANEISSVQNKVAVTTRRATLSGV